MDTNWYQLHVQRSSPALRTAANTAHFSVTAIVVTANSRTIVEKIGTWTTVTVLPGIQHVVPAEVASLHKANGVVAICMELTSNGYIQATSDATIST